MAFDPCPKCQSEDTLTHTISLGKRDNAKIFCNKCGAETEVDKITKKPIEVNYV